MAGGKLTKRAVDRALDSAKWGFTPTIALPLTQTVRRHADRNEKQMNDPLDVVFETPEESLVYFLRTMPKSLIPVFEREFMRRPTTGAVDVAKVCPECDGAVEFCAMGHYVPANSPCH